MTIKDIGYSKLIECSQAIIVSQHDKSGFFTTPSVPPVANTLPSLLKRVTFYEGDVERPC
jgi:hypothetical protein